MKNLDKNSRKKETSSEISITAALCEQSLLQSVVEELAYRRIDIGYSNQIVPPGLTAVETSSIEAHVSGDMNISAKGDFLDVPFTTCFLFTCIKAKGSDYSLSWSSSLS
jgi:hypothetical protein